MNTGPIRSNLNTLMDTSTDLLNVECVCSRRSGATCLFLVTADAWWDHSEDFWAWLHKLEMTIVVTPENLLH